MSKKTDDNVKGYPIEKRVRTYNPQDKKKRSTSKVKDDSKDEERYVSVNNKKKDKSIGLGLAIFWAVLFVAAVAGVIYWKWEEINAFLNKIFNATYFMVGWGIIVVLVAVLVAILIIKRQAVHDFFLYKLRSDLWHYWIGGVVLVFAVWGVLGLFDLGGKVGFYIVGEYLIFNYIRVTALFLLGLILICPKPAVSSVKAIGRCFGKLFTPLDEEHRKPRKKDKNEKSQKEEIIEGLNDNLEEAATAPYGYVRDDSVNQSPYYVGKNQNSYGFVRPEEKPAIARNTTTARVSGHTNQTVITGRTAVASSRVSDDYQEKPTRTFANVNGFVDPRKYRDLQTTNYPIEAPSKKQTPKTNIKPAPAGKYGDWGYMTGGNAAADYSYDTVQPSRTETQPVKNTVKYDDYSFSKSDNVTVISPNTPDLPQKNSLRTGKKDSSNILRFTDVEPYLAGESPIPHTEANYRPTVIESTRPKPTTTYEPSPMPSYQPPVYSSEPVNKVNTASVNTSASAPSFQQSYSPTPTVKKKSALSSEFLPFDIYEEDETEKKTPLNKVNPYNTKVDDVVANPVIQSSTQVSNVNNKSWRPDMSAIPTGEDGWKLPRTDLLLESDTNNLSEQDHERTASMIEEALASYGVDARVVAINPGPAVTQFGVEPGYEYKIRKVKSYDEDGNPITIEEKIPGNRVRVDKIKSLTDDLQRALQAPTIRVEAPVPNQSYVGIEIPNKKSSSVSLRSIIESDSFKKLSSKSKLTVALGQGTGGDEMCADVAKMPHLLIAGATGSGKSVCLNAIIASLIMNNTPTELKMIMIDPKRLEMPQYATLPHLLTPVIVEADVAITAMRWLQAEMERRLIVLQAAKARNIEQYNSDRTGLEKMPNIVLIIDELADLMMTGFNEAETILCRIAQLARAVGIHLIVATQRPSVNVVTGLIKANFPTRISFAVTSIVDSRTILDMAGAEKLLGKGDMLYAPPGIQPLRLQGCLVTDEEIQRLVYFWGTQNGPNTPMIDLSTVPIEQSNGSTKNTPNEDVLMPKVREMGKTTTITTSLLQRKLGIGYPRAARLSDKYKEEMAEMEDMDGLDEGAEIPEDEFDDDYED